MAETKLPQAGYKGVLTLDTHILGAGGDLKLTLTRKPMETSARSGSGHKEFIPGMLNWSISGSAIYMHADVGLLDLLDTGVLKKTLIAMTFLDADGFGFSGNVRIKSYKETEALNDAVKCQLELQGSGALTRVTGA